jgi:hypothetical protein
MFDDQDHYMGIITNTMKLQCDEWYLWIWNTLWWDRRTTVFN